MAHREAADIDSTGQLSASPRRLFREGVLLLAGTRAVASSIEGNLTYYSTACGCANAISAGPRNGLLALCARPRGA